MIRPSNLAILAALILLCSQQSALAHSSIAGSKGFTAGLLHPLFVPAHLLALAAAGLWIGQHGIERISKHLLAFAVALIIGSAIGLFYVWDDVSVVLLLLALALGLLVAAERFPPPYLALPLVASVALMIGMDSAPDASEGWLARVIGLTGTFIGAHLLILNLVAIVSSNRRPWVAIGFRVVGSWIAASTILVLAFEFKPIEAPEPSWIQASAEADRSPEAAVPVITTGIGLTDGEQSLR